MHELRISAIASLLLDLHGENGRTVTGAGLKPRPTQNDYNIDRTEITVKLSTPRHTLLKLKVTNHFTTKSN